MAAGDGVLHLDAAAAGPGRVARGYYRVAEPLLRLLVQRRIRRDYQRLKALLEAGSDRSAS